MPTLVHANTLTYAHTHVAANLVRSLKQLITECGLDASKYVGLWNFVEAGVSTWLGTHDLRRLVLDIYDPKTNALIKQFDFTIDYEYRSDGNGDLWIDPETTRYAIVKAGAVPSTCSYDILAVTSPGCPSVHGWGPGELRSTAGLQRRSVGVAIGGGNIGASLNYWS